MNSMLIQFTEQDVIERLTMPRAIAVLEQALCDEAHGQAIHLPRQRVTMDERTLHVLPAASGRYGYHGLKAYLSGGARTAFWYMLFDRDDLKALISADYLGRLRTGAASGLATKYLARTDAAILGVIGAGSQAATQIQAICEVRKISRVLIYSRNAAHRDAFAHEVATRFGVDASAVASAEEAVAAADVVVTITNSREPVLDGTWLKDGVHINAVGSNRAASRELDETTLARAGRIVVEDIAQAKTEAGDFIRAENFDWTRLLRLQDVLPLVETHAEPKRDRSEITIFKSLGIGLWDLALAIELLQTMH